MSDAGWCTSEPRTGLCSRCGKRFPGTTRHDTCCVIEMLYGRDFADLTRDMGMEKVLTAPRSPWQNPYVERLIGSIRRECLDHVIVWNQGSLRRILQNYFAYYQRSRTHLALAKDAPESRAVEKPQHGRIAVIPQVGGLHHRYQRQAA